MKELVLKSKVLKLDDYKSINVLDKLPNFECDVEKLEKDILRYQYAKGIKENVEIVEFNDLVYLTCTSQNKRFNHENKYVVVGRNVWDKTFEEKLIGCKKNETIELEINNEQVIVFIKNIERTTLPEFNDDNVKKWKIQNVQSVDDLKKLCFKNQVLSFYEDVEEAEFVTSHLFLELLTKCEFDLVENEINAVRKAVNKTIGEAKVLREKMIADGDVDPDDGWDMTLLAEDMINQTIRAATIGYQLLKESNHIPREDDYLKVIEKRKSYSNLSEEQLKENYNELDFLLEECTNYLFDEIESYVKDMMTNIYYERNKQRIDGFDVAIIGAGPAGLSAALTLNVHKKKIIWFGSDDLSNKVEKSEMIINYAGFDAITGKQLNERFKKQIEKNHLELTNKMVTQITKTKDGFIILADNILYKVKTVLLAIGAITSKGIENELHLLGHGVSYCATCDGFLYEGKNISVFANHPRYEHEVEYLAQIADQVYYYHTFKDSKIYLENVIHLEKPIKKVMGDDKVEAIQCTNDEIIQVNGAFFLRDAIAPSTILKGLKMNDAHIDVNRSCETNISGCYAAGDITGRPYQIAKAVGEGNIAAHSIIEHLTKQ